MNRQKIRFAAVGDCVVDVYPQQNKVFPGGAAGNVALRAKQAGAQSSIISAICTDKLGRLFPSFYGHHHINTRYLARLAGNTSQITIVPKEGGIPTFDDWKIGVLKDFRLTARHRAFLQRQDIAYATLFTKTRHIFNAFCTFSLPKSLKVGDFGGTSPFTTTIETIKKYVHGLDVFVKSIESTDRDSLGFLRTLSKKENKIAIVLMGKAGSIVYDNGKQFTHRALKVRAVDTTGAGDAYIAHFLVTYFKTKSIPQAMEQGTKAASRVVTQWGASSSR